MEQEDGFLWNTINGIKKQLIIVNKEYDRNKEIKCVHLYLKEAKFKRDSSKEFKSEETVPNKED